MSKVPFGHGVPDVEVDVIVLWPYSPDEIPEGWLLCDGNNGTPNLFDRFPKSISSASDNPGATGGSNTRTMTSSQLPQHNHTGSVSSTGSHSHSIGDRIARRRTSYRHGYRSGRNSTSDTEWDVASNGSHSHASSTSNSGSSNSIDNRPACRTFHYIMKA